MTPCPDWTLLVARRDETGRDPDGWSEAVDHMDRCDPCRRAALAADPTLVFRRLPRVETTAADVESMRSAVASLRRASRVTALAADSAGEREDAAGSAGVEVRREGGLESGRRSAFRRAVLRAPRLRQLAAAVLLVAAGFTVWITGGDDRLGGTAVDATPYLAAAALPGEAPLPEGTVSSLSSSGLWTDGARDRFGDSGLEPNAASGRNAAADSVADLPSAAELATRPVFEGLSRPRAADVYQVGDEDLLVVMVVDETLDI